VGIELTNEVWGRISLTALLIFGAVVVAGVGAGFRLRSPEALVVS
jgi:hypothetical protein